MATYEVLDRSSGNTFQFWYDKEPTTEQLKRRLNQEKINAIRRLNDGSTIYQGLYSRTKKNKDQRVASLNRDIALSLNMPIDRVDVSEQGLGIGDKVSLGLRPNPLKQLDFLRNKYGQDSVFAINIDGSPRLMLRYEDEAGLQNVKAIDEEGFTFSDIGLASKPVAQTIGIIGATYLTIKSGGLALPVLGKMGTGATALTLTAAGTNFAMGMGIDTVINTMDAVEQEKPVLERLGRYLLPDLQQNAVETVVGAMIDYPLLKTGSMISRFALGRPDELAQEYISSAQRLNSKYADEQVKLNLLGGARVSEDAIQADLRSQASSPLVRNNLEMNREVIARAMNALTTGKLEPINVATRKVAENIKTSFDNITKKIGKNDKAITDALLINRDRYLARHGINPLFQAQREGYNVQNVIFRAFNAVTEQKNSLYKFAENMAAKEGIEYGADETLRAIIRGIKKVSGSATIGNKTQKATLSAVSAEFGTKLRRFEDLENFITDPALKGNKRLTFKQVQFLIDEFQRLAEYNPMVGKTTQNRIGSLVSKELRDVRDSAFKGKKKGFRTQVTSGKGRATYNALKKADEYYNDTYLRFFRVGDGALVQSAKGSRAGDFKFQLDGVQALDMILDASRPSNISEVMMMLRSGGIDPRSTKMALQNRYIQQHGGDGTFLLNKGSQIDMTDVNMLTELFGERLASGALLSGQQGISKNLATVRAKVRAFEDINKASRMNPNKITELAEADVRRILNASTPKEVKEFFELLTKKRILNDKADELMATRILKDITKQGFDFLENPDIFAKALLEAPSDVLRTITKGLDEVLAKSPETVDALRIAVIEKLYHLADGGKANIGRYTEMTRMGKPLFDPNKMLKLLDPKTRTGINAEKILGKEIIKDLRDQATVLKNNASQTVAKSDAGIRPVYSGSDNGANVTVVAGGLVPMVGRFMHGIMTTNPISKRLFRGKIDFDTQARMYKYVAPASLLSGDGLYHFHKKAQYDVETRNALQEIMQSVYNERLKNSRGF
jgi:hypothetical protein